MLALLMELLLVRHADALDSAPGASDADRPLSDRGRERFALSVKGLLRLDWKVDAVLTSPLRRAVETAELLRPLLRPGARISPCDQLAAAPGPALYAHVRARTEAPGGTAVPGGPAAIPGQALRPWRMALVGHEPWMGRTLGQLLSRTELPLDLSFKKGGIALLEGEPEPGGMRLRAFLPPAITRLLGSEGGSA